MASKTSMTRRPPSRRAAESALRLDWWHPRGRNSRQEAGGLPLFIGTISRPAAPVVTVAIWAQTSITNWV
jgi:hypothetical protein